MKRDQLRGLCSEGGKGLSERVLVQVKVVDRDEGQDNCKLSMKRKDGMCGWPGPGIEKKEHRGDGAVMDAFRPEYSLAVMRASR